MKPQILVTYPQDLNGPVGELLKQHGQQAESACRDAFEKLAVEAKQMVRLFEVKLRDLSETKYFVTVTIYFMFSEGVGLSIIGKGFISLDKAPSAEQPCVSTGSILAAIHDILRLYEQSR